MCSKRTPLKSADVALIHRDETLRVPGVNAAELAGNIWSILDARARLVS